MNFRHSGATGDIIFSLPTIKAMGGGTLYITPFQLGDPYATVEDMKKRGHSVAPLIKLQPYITDCIVAEHWDQVPGDCVNLDLFRGLAGHHYNLVNAHLNAQGIYDESWKYGWLTLPDFADQSICQRPYWIPEGAYTVINRTSNYADPNFNWTREVHYLLSLSDRCFFIGYKSEYETFVCNFGAPVHFIECDFLQAAYLIKDAVMFTGCYSAMSTIAMGLGINYRLEQAPGHTCSSLLMPRETIVNAG